MLLAAGHALGLQVPLPVMKGDLYNIATMNTRKQGNNGVLATIANLEANMNNQVQNLVNQLHNLENQVQNLGVLVRNGSAHEDEDNGNSNRTRRATSLPFTENDLAASDIGVA